MNTTEGTNTNPTAVNLARIVYHTERMYNAAVTRRALGTDEYRTQAERDAYHAILRAVAAIAARNGNDPAHILEDANEIVNQNGLNP